MVNWWNAMSVFEQVLASLGVVSVLMLIIQAVMALFGALGGGAADMGDQSGADFSGDVDFGGDAGADFSGDIGADMNADVSGTDISHAASGLTVFTVQGVVTFFAIFSWSGLLLVKSGLHIALGLMVAAILGYFAMFAMAAVMRSMVKLQYDGTTDIRNAIGSVGTVYLTVPPARSHFGKVTVLVQGRLAELDAITDDEQAILTGTQVFVSGVSGKNTLLVKRK